MYYITMQNNPTVSVIVASHRPGMVKCLLTGLKNQLASDIVFEVIIVSDYPTGALQQEYPDFLWLYVQDTSISKKRNCGVKIASGELLAFIDDDCIPSIDWIAKGCTYFQNHIETSAVEGKTVIDADPSFKSGVLKEYRRLEKRGFRTNNLFFRTTVFRTIGGFDERFSVQREDMDLAFTALSHGFRIDFCEEIKVTHRFRSWEKWDLLKNCWNRRFDPLLYKKHPALYRKFIGTPLTPSIMLTIVLTLLFLLSVRNKRLFAIAGALELATLSGTGIRRCGMRRFSFVRWRDETLQLIAAPFVTEAALIYGSWRFRKLLIA
jgi:glycosyltransferase involved in cell wall biosynthesis